MPIGEQEEHPYLQQGNIEGAKSLILGTFPVYWCTDSDSILKQKLREEKGAFRFFYGSHRSRLWNLYAKYVDNFLVEPYDSQSILKSLTSNKIAISDLILRCERQKYSALDSDLMNKEWNINGITTLLEKENISKILCTSKFVLSSLTDRIISKSQSGSVNRDASNEFKVNFINKVSGNIDYATGSIAQVYDINGRKIEAVAIPSPGSPYRQLHTFGYNQGDRRKYGELYFENAFEWLFSH